jgi:GntR family transcriptional regulator
VDIAVGTDVIRPEPITGSILAHIKAKKSLRADYATERLTPRRVDETEATALDVPSDEAVLSVVIAAHQSSGAPIVTSRIVMPGSHHEIEDSYPLS